MNKVLYIVESAFPLLGALEAIAYYKPNDHQLVVRLSSRENEKQLLKVVDDLEVDKSKIIFIGGYKYGEIFKKASELKFLIWLFFHKNNYTNFFLGDYHSRYLTLLRKKILNTENIIYLDDGAATLRVQDSFHDDSFFDWFTVYDVTPLPQQSITNHDFAYLRSQLKKSTLAKSNEIIILGDKFYEAGLLSWRDSCLLLEKLMCKLKGETILYMAHRGESFEKLEYIEKKFNIVVVKNNFPIELYGLYFDQLPKAIVAFFSTALYSLQKIYPEIDVKLYKMDTRMLTSYTAEYNEAYKAYEPYMEIIDLSC